MTFLRVRIPDRRITVGFACFLFAIGTYTGLWQLHFYRTGLNTSGKIVRENCHWSAGRAFTYTCWPVVQLNAQNSTFTFQDQLGSFNHHDIGSDVLVLYDPLDPINATIDRGRGNWRAPGLLLIGSIFLFLISFNSRKH
jgi:hypothetical protein